MKLNWFSPLPPARTGIAEHSLQVLGALRQRAEVVVWTDQTDCDRSLGARYYDPARMPWDELDRADLNVYQMGNSPFHEAIWRVSRRCPGLVVLHDLHLAHFCRHTFSERGRFSEVVGDCYGEPGRAIAESLYTGRMPEWASRLFPMTDIAVGDVLGVVVHTRKGLREFSKRRDLPVTHLQLPYPTSNWPPKQPSRRDPYQITVFGHLGSNRCLGKLLHALAGFPWRERFRLNIYGEVVGRESVERLVESLGLRPFVRLFGPVPDVILDAVLEETDLAINLRYPTMGEASHSQLRLWDHALPTIVTKVGWYAELPADSVAWVKPGEEVAEIQSHLLAFLRDPEAFRKMGERGRRCLESRHLVEEYVTGLLRFADEIRDRGARRAVATGVAGATEGWANEAMRDWLRESADKAFVGMTRRRTDEPVDVEH